MTKKDAKLDSATTEQADTVTHSKNTFDDQHGVYTAQDCADALEKRVNVKIRSATLRARWMPYVIEAIGDDRARPDGLYSELALHLIIRYYREIVANNWPAKVQGAKSKAWVKVIRDEYPAVTRVDVFVVEDDDEASDLAPVEPSETATDLQVRRVDEAAAALAAVRRHLEAERAALIDEVEENKALQDEAAELARLHRQIEIERDELRRIKAEQNAEAEEAEIRSRVRKELGKS